MERIQPISGFPKPGDGYGAVIAHGQDVETDADEREIDIRGLLMTVWRGKWIIAICVLISAVIGFLATTQQAPVYRASAKVMFDTPRANVDAGEAVVDSTLNTRGALQNQIEILRSTSLIKRVVDDLNLLQNPTFNPSLRPPPPDTWKDKLTLPPEITDLLQDMGIMEPPPPPPVDTPASRAAAAARMERIVISNVLRGLALVPVDYSEVIEIGFTSSNPRLSAAVVNSVANQYIVDQLEGKLETFRSATQWLTDRVANLQERVENAEAAVLQAQAEIADEAGASLDATRGQLASLSSARGQARSQTSTLRAQYTRLSEAVEMGTAIETLTELRTSPEIAKLLLRENELQTQDDQLAITLRSSHPIRIRVADELENLRIEMQEEAKRLLESLSLDLEASEAREEQLAADIRVLEEQVLKLSTESVEIRNLEREAQASRILYENLLARLQETNAQEDLQSADARILTFAEPPLGPVRTQKQRTLQVAIIVGFALGIGIVFLLDRLNNTFRSPHQLEQMVGQPVLATIPTAGQRLKRNDVIQVLREKPNSSLAESIRNLRTSILFSNIDNPPKVIMFSSSVPREGKSTTSMLMALTSRQMGKSAIIVDCDLRMPALSKVLKVDDEQPGLLAVIDDTATVEEAIYKEPDTGLHVLMTRSAERNAKINAADVLASDKFKQLVEDLSKTYDLVVLDTPPTLVVTDARIVSALADAVVFAVRWDSTPRSAVQEGIRELISVRAQMTGVVMTQVNEQKASRYAYDGYSYYKGRYRDYYET